VRLSGGSTEDTLLGTGLETRPEADGSAEPLTTLRGASVAVDARAVGRVVVAICLASLAIVAAVLFVAGAHKNAQITGLQQHGDPVVDTVVACSGLLGGSGSNGAGYRCWGTFTVDGHRYTKDIPGNVLRTAGSKVLVIADTADPGLISTPSVLASEHASSGVFILPAVLLGVVVVTVGALALRRRSTGLLPVLRLRPNGSVR
jgi:hypothetical protein